MEAGRARGCAAARAPSLPPVRSLAAELGRARRRPWPPRTRACASAAWSRPPGATAPGCAPPAGHRRPAAGCRRRPARSTCRPVSRTRACCPRSAPHLQPIGHSGRSRRSATPSPGPGPSWSSWRRQRLAADGVPVARAGAHRSRPARSTRSNGCSRPYLRPGDRVGVEDPGWANLIDLVAALGLDAVPIAGRRRGTHRRRAAPGARGRRGRGRRHQPGPEPDRRRGIAGPGRPAAADARRPDPTLLVIEDDHAAELAEVPLAPLAGAGRDVGASSGRSPSRTGRTCGSPSWPATQASIARVEGRLRLGAGWVSTVLQRLVVELWRDPAVSAAVAAAARASTRGGGRPCWPRSAGAGWPPAARTGINMWVSTVGRVARRGGPARPGLGGRAGLALPAGHARPGCGSPSSRARHCPMWQRRGRGGGARRCACRLPVPPAQSALVGGAVGSLTTLTKNSSIWRTTAMKRSKSTGLVTYALACSR